MGLSVGCPVADTPVAVAQLMVAVVVIERTEVIVCVRVSSRLRVVVLVMPSVDVTLADTLLETLGVTVMLVVSDPFECVLL